jgi:hypothetical protein
MDIGTAPLEQAQRPAICPFGAKNDAAALKISQPVSMRHGSQVPAHHTENYSSSIAY